MTPTKDAAVINHYANHPDIRPVIGGDGELDLSNAIYDPQFALVGGFGAASVDFAPALAAIAAGQSAHLWGLKAR